MRMRWLMAGRDRSGNGAAQDVRSGREATSPKLYWSLSHAHIEMHYQRSGLAIDPFLTHSRRPVTGEIVTTCAICGDSVRSAVELGWRPSKKAEQAHLDMQEHLMTHSFAELLRFEIRQDLELVPDDQRPLIVRDIYRSMLGTTRDGEFTLFDSDSKGVYTIDEALGDLQLYSLWRSANGCSRAGCNQH